MQRYLNDIFNNYAIVCEYSVYNTFLVFRGFSKWFVSP